MNRWRIAVAAMVALALAGAASAQVAPQRTWPELKEAVQERADRDAYPLTGTRPEEVRQILSEIGSLDRDDWARAWSRMGDRHAARADALANSDRAAAADAYLMAFRYYAFGGWPTQNSSGKKESFAKSVAAFRRHGELADPPLEHLRIPFEGAEIRAYLALPKDVRPAPVVLAIGGLDAYKEYWCERVEHFLKAGLGVLCLDMPGTGESPIRIDVGAERIYSTVIDRLLTRPDVDGKRLAVIGASWGGYWSTVLGFTEKDRLRGSVYWGGPSHRYFQQEWQEKALGTREYLFDLFAARASVYRVGALEDFLAYGPRMSLQARGFIGKPSTAMLLINGERDSQVPIDDLYLLLRAGTPKEAWVNPQGGHMGRGPGWPDSRIFAEVALPWLVRVLRSE
jgi:pimeloyl-ACP methyl ester carboxylesterase